MHVAAETRLGAGFDENPSAFAAFMTSFSDVP
jgi:hypothetical protein